MEEKLVKNVLDFIGKCAKQIGDFEEDNFSQNTFNECLDLGIESPIEQILYCALKAVREFNFINQSDPIEICGKDYLKGLEIKPQEMVGNYRVDFKISYFGRIYPDETQDIKIVIVECDSQQFHERTEKERRYEKKRDRFLITKGYKTFHYTGSEIVKNAFEIAAEIISFVTGIEDIVKDNNLE